jgi:hypothetical protein
VEGPANKARRKKPSESVPTPKPRKKRSAAAGDAKPKHPGRWKTGQSGNPKGAPKRGQSLVERISLQLEQAQLPNRRQATDLSLLDKLAIRWVREAVAGNWRFGNCILERLDGKVPERVDLNDGRVEVHYVRNWRPGGDDPDTPRGYAAGAAGGEADEPDPGGPAVAQDHADGDDQR